MTRAETIVAALLIALAFGTSSGVTVAAPGHLDATTHTVVDDRSEERLEVTDATLELEDTATVDLTLTEAPNGLAGFEVTLEFDDDVAAVTAATYPDTYPMTTAPAIDPTGQTVTLEAVDLYDEIEAGAEDVTLATIELEGVDDGATEIRIADARVDADGGAPIDPSLSSATVTVESPETDGSPQAGADSGSEPDESDSPGSGTTDRTSEADSSGDDATGEDELGTGPAFGMVALVITLLAVGRRRRRD